MNLQNTLVASLFLSVLGASCDLPSSSQSDLKITQVAQSSVKRQSIDNCWLYATAAWLESYVKSGEARDVNVSESYWTYWDMFERAQTGKLVDKAGFSAVTGGWSQATKIVSKYGWIPESEFIPGDESADGMSKAQRCATQHIEKSFKEKSGLFALGKATNAQIHAELQKAFSCEGRFSLNMQEAYNKRSKVDAVLLKGSQEVTNPDEKRIKKALNDRKPVILGFYMSFDLVDEQNRIQVGEGMSIDDATEFGGHMVLLNDYTVQAKDGEAPLAEGELDEAAKARALEAPLEYLIAKNSWGVAREKNEWLGNGYSKISWEYLLGQFPHKEGKKAVLKSVILPPGY